MARSRYGEFVERARRVREYLDLPIFIVHMGGHRGFRKSGYFIIDFDPQSHDYMKIREATDGYSKPLTAAKVERELESYERLPRFTEETLKTTITRRHLRVAKLKADIERESEHIREDTRALEALSAHLRAFKE